MKDIKEQESLLTKLTPFADDAVLAAKKAKVGEKLRKKYRSLMGSGGNKVVEQDSVIFRVAANLSDDAILAAKKADLLGKMKKKYREMTSGKDKSKTAQVIVKLQKDIIKAQEKIISKK